MERDIIKWRNKKIKNSPADYELLDATAKGNYDAVEFLLGFRAKDEKGRELHYVEKAILEYNYMKMLIKTPEYKYRAAEYFSSLGNY